MLPQVLSFDWDEGNINKNLAKHQVSDREAEEVFGVEPNFIFEDIRHSEKERRLGLFGQTKPGRLLSIVFTVRNDRIRVITARNMSRRERKSYQKILEEK